MRSFFFCFSSLFLHRACEIFRHFLNQKREVEGKKRRQRERERERERESFKKAAEDEDDHDHIHAKKFSRLLLVSARRSALL